MKNWSIVAIVVLAILGIYEWSVIKSLRAELADRGRLVQELKQSLPQRPELVNTGLWLHQYYKSQEGLQRPQGLWINDGPDMEGIMAWILDTYVPARIEGLSPEAARDRITQAIQATDEWKSKHR